MSYKGFKTIKELIDELEEIRTEHGDDCVVETFSNELTVYEGRGQLIKDIEI